MIADIKKTEHEMTVAGNGTPAEKDLLEVARQTALNMEKCKTIVTRFKETLNDN